MKGKIVSVNELVLGKKYWVESKINSEKQVHTYRDGLLYDKFGNYYTINYEEIIIYEYQETQYDRIKNMTIEEMSDFLRHVIEDIVQCGKNNCDDCKVEKCINYESVGWLNSKYKED